MRVNAISGTDLGKPYTIRTSIPLLETATVDVPIDQMVADAISEAKTSVAPVVIGVAGVAVLLALVATGVFVSR
jgi:hypothetical protein